MCGTEYFNLALFSEHRTDWPSWRKWKHWMYFENTIFLRLSKIVFFTFFFFLKCVEAQNPRRRASLLSLYWMAPQMVSDTLKTVSTAEVNCKFFRLECQSPKSGSFNLWTLEEASAWAWLGPQSSLAAPSEGKENFSGNFFLHHRQRHWHDSHRPHLDDSEEDFGDGWGVVVKRAWSVRPDRVLHRGIEAWVNNSLEGRPRAEFKKVKVKGKASSRV